MNHIRTTFAAIAAVVLLAACGDLGGIMNPGGSSAPANPSGGTGTSSQSVQGTVSYVDAQQQRIDMSVDAVNGRGVSPYNTTLYYDSRTRVLYNNQTYNPTNLERGDRIDVQTVAANNGQQLADTITVVGDVRSGSNTSPGGTYPTYPSSPTPTTPSSTATTQIQGTVNFVDPNAGRLDLTSAYVTGLRNSQTSTVTVYFDSRSRVLYQGQLYQPSDLERGDQVDVRAYRDSRGQYVADTITVTRNVRG